MEGKTLADKYWYEYVKELVEHNKEYEDGAYDTITEKDIKKVVQKLYSEINVWDEIDETVQHLLDQELK